MNERVFLKENKNCDRNERTKKSMDSDQIWSMPKTKKEEKSFCFLIFGNGTPFRELAERDDVTSFRYFKNFLVFFRGG